jgi:hypothetical protein
VLHYTVGVMLLGEISGPRPGATPSPALSRMLLNVKDKHKTRDWLLLQWTCLQEELCRQYMLDLEARGGAEPAEPTVDGLLAWLSFEEAGDATIRHVLALVRVLQHRELYHQVRRVHCVVDSIVPIYLARGRWGGRQYRMVWFSAARACA